MAIPWADRVKSSGRLSIYMSSSVTGGMWNTVIRDALREFNALTRAKRIGVTLTESQDAPAATGSGGADVEVATASGQFSSTYEGVTQAGTLNGNLMHGMTFQYQIDGKLEKAFIFLPRSPMVNTPRNRRAVGGNVMKVIAVHEFVHACGLSNSDHSTDDLFQASPQVDPGTTAAGDRVRIQSGRTMRWMPPLVFSASTVRLLKSVW